MLKSQRNKSYVQKPKLPASTLWTTCWVLLLMIFVAFIVRKLGDGDNIVAALVVGVFLVGMWVASMLFMPIKLSVDDKDLTVWFPFRYKSFPLDQIESVAPYQLNRNTYRAFGSGGFLGYWGWFRNKDLGRFMMYSTQKAPLLALLMSNGKRYVISCLDPIAMADAINNAIRSLSLTTDD